jgi:hypothetical protein
LPIRVAPFESIDAAVIESLGPLQVREDRTLDFKRDLNLADRDAHSEFLKDVTALANASGGTLLYGIEEGQGEEEGLAAHFPGIELPQSDATHRLIEDLLRHSVDERPMGVLHRAVRRSDGRFYYVVRVPPSPLAPHMVTVGKHRSKFFLRANTTTDTMDARQIKETSLKAASAFERALSVVEERRRVLIEAIRRAPEDGGSRDHPTDSLSQLMLHVVPLFPAQGGFPIADARVVDRLAALPPLNWSVDNLVRRFTLEGLHFKYGDRVRAAYLRSGAAEFQEHPVSQSNQAQTSDHRSASTVNGWQICQDVLRTLDECAGLTADGLLPLPLVVCLTLSGVSGSRLKTSPRGSGTAPEELDLDVVPLTPVLLHAWDDVAAGQTRTAFDELSQAWGLPRDRNYVEGRRIWWSDVDRMPAPSPRFWKAGWQAGG